MTTRGVPLHSLRCRWPADRDEPPLPTALVRDNSKCTRASACAPRRSIFRRRLKLPIWPTTGMAQMGRLTHRYGTSGFAQYG